MKPAYIELFYRTLPELAMTLTAFLALGADLVWLRRKDDASRLRDLVRLTLLGLMASTICMYFVSTMEDGYFNRLVMQGAPTDAMLFYQYYLGMLAANSLSAL